MAHVAGGGGHVGGPPGGAAGGDDDPPQRHNRSNPPGFQFKDWKYGNTNLSTQTIVSIIDNDDQVIIYLQESGMVDDTELKVFAIPDNYVNQSERTMTALRGLMVLFNSIAVGRRKYLYLVVKSIYGEGSKGDEKRCEELMKKFFLEKNQVWEYHVQIKTPRPKFSKMPEFFNTVPAVISKKRV